MANRKCNYCSNTMNRVVWGMTTTEEMDKPKPLTEYAGCITDPLPAKWHCDVCDSQVIPELDPKSGICLQEAPKEVLRGLNFVVARLEEFAGNDDRHQPVIEVICSGSEPENFTEEEVQNHKSHGDCLLIEICNCQTLYVYFDGFGMSRELSLESLYHGHLEESLGYRQFSVDSIKDLPRKLTDLYFGSTVLSDLIDLIGEKAMIGCQKDFICEDSRNWELLAYYWANQKELFPNYWLDRHHNASDVS